MPASPSAGVPDPVPTPDRESSRDDAATLRERVRKRGVAIVSIAAADDVPMHSYTVGLGPRGLPEFILFGFSPDVAVPVLEDIALRLRDGERLAPRTTVDDVLPGMPVVFVEVPGDLAERYLPEALAFAPHGRGVLAWQVVWPDRHDRFPWQRDYDPRWRHRQLLLRPVG